jgi:Tfp pilus assembly protein PilV
MAARAIHKKMTKSSQCGASLIEYTIATGIFLVALLAISVMYENLAQNHVDNVLRQQAERQSPFHSDMQGLCYEAPDGKCY